MDILTSELINQENQEKEVFYTIHIDKEGEIKKVPHNLPLYGGVGVLTGNIETRGFLYYVYRYKMNRYHVDKIEFDIKPSNEKIIYHSKETQSINVQMILLIEQALIINRVEFEHLYKVLQKSILMPSVGKKWETIKLNYNV